MAYGKLVVFELKKSFDDDAIEKMITLYLRDLFMTADLLRLAFTNMGGKMDLIKTFKKCGPAGL